MPRTKLPTKEYIISRTTPIPSSGCWLWENEKLIGIHGYITLGKIGYEYYLVHQAVYELWTGQKPPRQGSGYEIHHKCEIKICCNPDHLELRSLVSHRQEHGNQYRDVTHCINGHVFSEENTYIIPSSNARQCRKCIKEYATTYYQNNKEKWVGYKNIKNQNLNFTSDEIDILSRMPEE